jgi:Mrp family chromosome partitioning ATPase
MATALAPLLGAVRPMLDGPDGVVLQIVAATPGEGASTVAREFAFLAGTTGRRRTLLIDADRADPQIGKSFGCDTRFGLIDCLWDRVDDADVLHAIAGTLLSVACLIGSRGPSAVDADTLREIYGGLRDHYDLVVIDCPSVAGGRFADLSPEAADGIVLVVQAEKTRPAVISHAKSLVEQAGGRLLGAVLNKRTNYIPEFLYRML